MITRAGVIWLTVPFCLGIVLMGDVDNLRLMFSNLLLVLVFALSVIVLGPPLSNEIHKQRPQR